MIWRFLSDTVPQISSSLLISSPRSLSLHAPGENVTFSSKAHLQIVRYSPLILRAKMKWRGKYALMTWQHDLQRSRWSSNSNSSRGGSSSSSSVQTVGKVAVFICCFPLPLTRTQRKHYAANFFPSPKQVRRIRYRSITGAQRGRIGALTGPNCMEQSEDCCWGHTGVMASLSELYIFHFLCSVGWRRKDWAFLLPITQYVQYWHKHCNANYLYYHVKNVLLWNINIPWARNPHHPCNFNV